VIYSRRSRRREVSRLKALAVSFLISAPMAECISQSVGTTADTSVALTPEMRLLDQKLLAEARSTLERWGTTFHAYALYMPTSSLGEVMEIGAQHSVDSRQPSAFRDSLRSALRVRQAMAPEASVIGVITDSVAGPIEEAVDGAEGPDFPRMAVTELEDRSGRCRRIERDYHFAKDPPGHWAWGSIVFGPRRVTRCEPLRYWPTYAVSEAPVVPSRPRLAAPILRPLDISSLGVIFTVVGDMHGKLTVFNDSIVVAFDSLVATRQLRNDTRRVLLDSIRVGVGMGDDKSWTPVDDSKALKVGRVLPPGGKLVWRGIRFVLPHKRREEDAESWIVVTFHLTSGKRGQADYHPDATTYAHSKKGILAN